MTNILLHVQWKMLNYGGFRVEILTSRIARNVAGGIVARREEDRRLGRGIYKILVINRLTRHSAFLHANGMTFVLRKVYVLGCKRQAFGW